MTKKPVPKILPHSLHKGSGWKTHFEKLERWLNRIDQSHTKEDLSDFIFTFFQNCYHLREWLIETTDIEKEDINSLFNDNEEMGICRDICNVTKHYQLRDRPSQNYEISFAQEYAPKNHPYRRPGWFGDDANFLVVADDKNYDAKKLAHKCFNIWKEFLFNHGLIE